ncbi:transporter [Zunongwangia sp. HRR-M8]|uniref:transporter n=1 Tax=Zunongwangia sp. HRR-M8 TaxID=3015170 RepID=UPI0022DDAA99|nr:transporter [Zunongwangia sp. HRR-M8]WBL23667.1 transporter [Zunongwangia sp. HRR-M8]
MQRLTAIVFAFLANSILCNAQFTETINSNRPGQSQGAFAVGTGVYQLEAGGFYGNNNHDLRGTDTDLYGANYMLRAGFLSDILELSIMGRYQFEETSILQGGQNRIYERSNFPFNTIGAKVLLYDPYKNGDNRREVNLKSWKANQKFDWRQLIPAVSLYGGANVTIQDDNPYRFEGENKYTPKVTLITQHNWGRWVWVMNLTAEKFTETYPSYQFIGTLTHAFNPKFAIFGEYQAIFGDLYADDLFRAGAAYLVTDYLQFDLAGLANVKDTPSRWQVQAGLSVRLNFHKDIRTNNELSREGKRNEFDF